MNYNTALKASEWWWDKYINHRPFADLPKELNENGHFDRLLQERLLTNKDGFIRAFCKYFMNVQNDIWISIDYHPERDGALIMIFEALPSIQLCMSTFPHKLDMRIHDDHILIREGHYGNWEVLNVN